MCVMFFVMYMCVMYMCVMYMCVMYMCDCTSDSHTHLRHTRRVSFTSVLGIPIDQREREEEDDVSAGGENGECDDIQRIGDGNGNGGLFFAALFEEQER